MRGNWDPEKKGLAKATQLGSGIVRRWHSQEAPGIGLKPTSSSPKTPSFRSDQDSRVGGSGCRPVRDWPLEFFAWSLFLIHSCVFPVSGGCLEQRSHLCLFLSTSWSHSKGMYHFQLLLGQLYWTLSFLFIFSYFLPNNCLCFWGRVLGSFLPILPAVTEKGSVPGEALMADMGKTNQGCLQLHMPVWAGCLSLTLSVCKSVCLSY